MSNNEERKTSNPGYQRFRGTLHIAMGIFYLVIAVLLFYAKHFGALELSSGFAYVLGSLMLLYGMFRLWRGFADIKAMSRRDMRRDFPSLDDKGETTKP